MARKKTRKKIGAKKHHTRKRVGAIQTESLTDDIMELAGLAIGQISGGMVSRQMTTVSPKVIGAAEVVGGIMLKKHVPGTFMNGLSWGIAGSGFMALAHDVGLIHGIDQACNKIFDRELHPEPQRIQLPEPQQPVNNPGMTIPNTPNATVVSGLFNNVALSGLSNYDMMNGGGEENWMQDEFNAVRPFGI